MVVPSCSRQHLARALLGLMMLAVSAPVAQAGPAGSSPIEAAVRHPDRPAADRERDGTRHPAAMLAFAGIAPGMAVADLMAGDGWYSEILARVVGSEGVVYAQNNGISAGRYGPGLALRLERGGLSNVLRVNAELDRLTFPRPLDAAIMVLFYHDTVWMQVDRGEMNRRIFEALKPGGRFLVIDHASLAPHEDRETRSLHRIGEQLVIRELRAAGFVLDARSDLLRNAADPHTDSAFSPGIRGRTDRFALLFRRPAAGHATGRGARGVRGPHETWDLASDIPGVVDRVIWRSPPAERAMSYLAPSCSGRQRIVHRSRCPA